MKSIFKLAPFLRQKPSGSQIFNQSAIHFSFIDTIYISDASKNCLNHLWPR